MIYLMAIWVACGIYNYGRDFAYWWRYMPQSQHWENRESECRGRAMIGALAGPVDTFVGFFQGAHKFGFKWRMDGQP